jgi:hypothetical protein
MKAKVEILDRKLVIETENLELIPEKVELYGKGEYAVYSLEAAWTEVIKDLDKVKERLKQFYLDDLVDELAQFGFDRFQLHIENYAVVYEIMITGIRSGKKGDILETLEIDEKIRGHEFCEIRHFETYKDQTQITVVCEIKTV